MNNNILSKFRDAMLQKGLVYDDEIIADGSFQRFGLPDDTGKPCWYVLNQTENGIIYGCFGCFKRGIQQNCMVT